MLWTRWLRSPGSRRKTSRPAPWRRHIEPLEDRTLLSASAVADLNPATADSPFSSFTPLGGLLFFVTDDGSHGRELWRSDGTAQGTALVKDIRPGSAGSAPSHLAVLNGVLYFAANDGSRGEELWRSDGTEAGTTLVRDLVPGAAGSSPYGITPAGSLLYFSAIDAMGRGQELFKSDGTAAGTGLVRDIRPGSGWSNPNRFTAVGGTVFFLANDGTHGEELWKSDGTQAGTVMVRDLAPGGFYSGSNSLTNVAGTLFFTAVGQLWKSDGTEAGTVIVRPTGSGGPVGASYLAAAGGRLFFSASDGSHGLELWTSDGTSQGTVMVRDIRPGSPGSEPESLRDVNGTLFFAVGRRVPTYYGTAYIGEELWKSDGTPQGTVLVRAIELSNVESAPPQLANVNGTLFFAADDGAAGSELWRTDGTPAGTVRVQDILPGVGSSSPTLLTNVSGRLFFAAVGAATGRELWTAGVGGVSLVADLAAGKGVAFVTDLATAPQSSEPADLVTLNGTVFFVAFDQAHGRELWRSDGTPQGTALVKDIRPGSASGLPPGPRVLPPSLTVVGNALFFIALTPEHGQELWKSDGTAAGTVLVKDIKPGSESSFLRDLTNLGGTLFFVADNGVYGMELWRSDGTVAGTVLVRDIRPGAATSNPDGLTAAGGALYFTANDGVTGIELWRSDGTAAGTALVRDINPGPASAFGIFVRPFLAASGGALFFVAFHPASGLELWRSDGTAAGTALVRDIMPGPQSAFNPYTTINPSLTDVGGTLFFVVTDDLFRPSQLWKSDGTEAGTVLVSGFAGVEVTPTALTSFHGTLLFTAQTAAAGRELWRSDGTAAGTGMVRDINAGPAGAFEFGARLVVHGSGLAYFAAEGGGAGRELWRSDGTAGGTELAADIFAGARGSLPGSLVAMGDALFFAADDGSLGRELWRFDAPRFPVGGGSPDAVPLLAGPSLPVTLSPAATAGGTARPPRDVRNLDRFFAAERAADPVLLRAAAGQGARAALEDPWDDAIREVFATPFGE